MIFFVINKRNFVVFCLFHLAHVSSIKDTVSTISCGNNHNIAVTSEGSLLGWGDNSDGQLGHKVEELKHSNLPW